MAGRPGTFSLSPSVIDCLNEVNQPGLLHQLKRRMPILLPQICRYLFARVSGSTTATSMIENRHESGSLMR